MATHYETLGIDTDASPEEIRKAYKKAVLVLHPDRYRKHKSHHSPNALDMDDPQLLLQASLHGTAAVMRYAAPPPEPANLALEKALLARFDRIQAAYNILSVPEKRQVYDKEMLADEEISLFGERKARREALREAWPTSHPPPVPEIPIDVKPPFVWDVDRKQPLFWDPNPQPYRTLPSYETEPGMQLIRKEDAATSKYIFTREAAVKRLVEINDENYGAFKFIKGVSLGAVELQSKDLVPIRRPARRRYDSAATLVAPEPATTPPPKEPTVMRDPQPVPPKHTDIRRVSQIVKLAHAMTTADMYQARLKLEKEQELLTQIEAVRAQERAHRLRVERERQKAQLEVQKRTAKVEKERERIRAEEELEALRIEQARLVAATAQLSAQMHTWPHQIKVAQKPQRSRANSDIGRQKEAIRQKIEVANEWGGWDAGGWKNAGSTGADVGWGAAWNGNWDNPNSHKPPQAQAQAQQQQEGRKGRTKERKQVNNAWVDGWGDVYDQPPATDITDTGRRMRSQSRTRTGTFSVAKPETKQRARSRERSEYWEQTQVEPEEKHQPKKLTKPNKVRFEMIDVPAHLRPYEPQASDESKGTRSGLRRLFGRA